LSAIPKHRGPRGRSLAALLPAVAMASAMAATSALQPAQSTFGAATERSETSSATKRPTTLGMQAAPALVPASAAARGSVATQRKPTHSFKSFFEMEDRAIIIVSGRQTTVGEQKRKLDAEITAKSGAPKTVRGSARKIDLAALNATSPATARAGIAQSKTASIARVAQAPALLTNQSLTQTQPSAKTTIAGMRVDKAGSYSAQKCLDKGPPVISEVRGTLKVGGQVDVWGRCFGDRAGRVEIIGQFPGGKLQAVFAAWDAGAVTIAIPGNVSGATDHTVAVSVVTAEGKVSPAVQAKFVAARARVEVPERLWSPSGRFELAANEESPTSGGSTRGSLGSNRAHAGATPMSVRVNPQCALDDVVTSSVYGSVTDIKGWELGPPYEASVTIAWQGTCSSFVVSRTENLSLLGPEETASSSCRVAFQARAWAYCPVGINP